MIKLGERKEVKMRKTVLFGSISVVSAVLLLAAFISMTSIVDVKATQWTELGAPLGVAIGDYDNDGLNDLAFSEYYPTRVVTVYKSDGTTVIKQWAGLSGPFGIAIGDYNNDGLNDIAIVESDAGRLTVYKSDGITVIKQWTGVGASCVAIGDYDNDGLNDLAFSTGFSSPYGNVTVYKSDGTTIIRQWAGLSRPAGVAIGDYDNDGLNDLGFAESEAGNVTVYRSDGTTVIEQWAGLNYPRGVAIGDYDNDGLNDLAFTEYSLTGKVTVNKGDGTTVVKQWTGLNGPGAVAIGDYNNDGLNDIAFPEAFTGRVTVYYQTKPGTVARVAEPTIVTLRGTLTNSSGYPIQSGSIRVTVKDSFGTQVWQDTFNDAIYDGRYNLLLGAKTTLMLIKGQIYSAILEVDADSPTFVSADIIVGDNNPSGDLVKFVAG